ncbi:MAG: methyl-accepting chemotaxis protein [Candidatus Nitrospinota bacterium M3_3B_026]
MRKILFSLAIIAMTAAAGAAQGESRSASPEDIYFEFVNTPVMPEPVELASEKTLKTLEEDWLGKAGAEEAEGAEKAAKKGEYSSTFWVVIIAVAVLIVMPLVVSFGAAARKISLNLKLYNSHGSLVLLALFLGVSGYIYISGVSQVTDLDGRFQRINGTVNKIYAAQNNFLLYGVKDKKYGESQLADISSTLDRLKAAFAAIRKNESVKEGDLAAISSMEKSLTSYRKSLDKIASEYNNIERLKKETGQTVLDVSLDLTELTQHFRATLDMLNMEGAAYEKLQFHTLMVKRLTGAEGTLRRVELLKADFLRDNNVKHVKDMADYLSMLKGALEAIRTGLQSAEEKSLYESVAKSVDDYIKKLRRLVQDTASLNADLETMMGQITRVRQTTSEVSRGLGSRAATITSEANAAAMILIAMALLVGVIPTFLVTRSITEPLARVVKMIKEMSAGRLDTRLNIDRDDEIGQMAKAMDSFADDLQFGVVGSLQKLAEGDLTIETNLRDERDAIMGALKRTVEDLNRIVSQINAAGDQIAGGAAQVADSSNSLSQTATEQAGSIEQITSAIEQISSQTKLNADNAKQANQLVLHTREAAEDGNRQMKDMLTAMEEINESGANVSKIIKVIDEIAFQTNLLALNAAVEAARAGKHGKGFAVVAEEVRNLAARSAQAARETAELIESSVDKARNGADIADRTADSLSQIVGEVTKVTDLVGEIASASADQARGLEEVNRGVGEIDKIVQQNAAIAEQSASAAEELSSQAESLKEMLSRFRLKESKGLLTGGTERMEHDRPETPAMEEEDVKPSSAAGRRPSDIISLDEDF